MPFGLTNTPAVFQHIMQQVISTLNPESAPEFVSVYVDNILFFQEPQLTLAAHQASHRQDRGGGPEVKTGQM